MIRNTFTIKIIDTKVAHKIIDKDKYKKQNNALIKLFTINLLKALLGYSFKIFIHNYQKCR